jgi:hypothetical protein
MIGKCDDEAPQITRNIPSRNISCNWIYKRRR